MEAQVPKLEQYYKKSAIQRVQDKGDGDDFFHDGDYWEFQYPEKVECWSIFMIPCFEQMCFVVKFKGMDAYFPLSYDERIKDVVEDVHPTIKVHCVTTQNEVEADQQYNFTIHFDSEKIPFRVTNLLKSLETTSFQNELKELEDKVNEKCFLKANGEPLTGRRLCAKIRALFQDFAVLKTKIVMDRRTKTTRTVMPRSEVIYLSIRVVCNLFVFVQGSMESM